MKPSPVRGYLELADLTWIDKIDPNWELSHNCNCTCSACEPKLWRDTPYGNLNEINCGGDSPPRAARRDDTGLLLLLGAAAYVASLAFLVGMAACAGWRAMQ